MTKFSSRLCFIGHWCLVIGAFPTAAYAEAGVTAERSEHGIVVKIDGHLFTEYRTRAGHAPAMWPVIGPTGKAVTRGYPFTPAAKDGTHDHPHHQSFWFAHDKVNGVNYWGTNVNDDKVHSGPHVDHREFATVESIGSIARIVARDDWMNDDARVCEDERTIAFGVGADDARWIDFTITIRATKGDVTFGDTKEGSFALRVADSMRVDANKGGRIVNSEGQENADAWGRPARWVDYTGPVDGETVGIAVVSHPKSFRPTPRWHVRTYGLFAANPFGESDFPKLDGVKQGPVTIKNGDSLTLRYLVWLHLGKLKPGEMNMVYERFAGR